MVTEYKIVVTGLIGVHDLASIKLIVTMALYMYIQVIVVQYLIRFVVDKHHYAEQTQVVVVTKCNHNYSSLEYTCIV